MELITTNIRTIVGLAFLFPSIILADTSVNDTMVVYIYDKEDFGSYYREQIFIGVRDDSRIPIYLSYPKDGKPKAIVFLLHGITGHKEIWWQADGPYSSRSQYQKLFLQNGIATVAMDAQFHGQRSHELNYRNPKNDLLHGKQYEKLYEMLDGSVQDAQMILGYLTTRPEFKGLKIGVLGDSMGGIMSFRLAVEDRRIAFVITLATPPLPVPDDKNVTSISPLTLSQKMTKPIRLIAATKDKYYSISLMTTMFNNIGSRNKNLIIVDEPHDFQTTHAKELAHWVLDVVK